MTTGVTLPLLGQVMDPARAAGIPLLLPWGCSHTLAGRALKIESFFLHEVT